MKLEYSSSMPDVLPCFHVLPLLTERIFICSELCVFVFLQQSTGELFLPGQKMPKASQPFYADDSTGSGG